MKLEKFNYSDGKGKRMFLYGFILCAVLMILINLFFSEAKYLNTESLKIAEGTISYKPYDFKIMAMYQENDSGEYQEINSIPINGYRINEEKSYCTIDNINKDSNAILKTIGNEHSIKNISPNDKCYLYFDKVVVSKIEDIINSRTIARRTDFSTILTEDTTGTIFVAEDDYGISYYYAGAVQDNWVKFAGFYWRITRINGDGTLRMIYSGSEESGPATTGDATQIGTSAFNENYNDNAYVGYMYGTPRSSGYEETHANKNNITIKQYIDNWYENNLINYENYIDTNAGFCGDRKPSTSTSLINESGGTGTTTTYYGDYIRYYNSGTPVLTCANSNDLYTISNSSRGNKALTRPIGLINMNEIWLGGGYQTSNLSYYLYTGQYYWGMSPGAYGGGGAGVFRVSIDGWLDDVAVGYVLGVRPVINLKSDTQFSSGDGTISNPYVVS